jgi:large subunit ribosomal protein L46
MNTWMVGYHPVAWHSFKPRAKKGETTEIETPGNKVFFLKSRIMAGQADLSINTQNLKDFKWLAKEEIAQYLNTQYYSNIKNMLADR